MHEKKGKPNGGERYDWNALKTEYVTSNISIKKLAEKHGIRQRTVADRCRKGGWVEERKKFLSKVTSRAISKVASKQADKLARELKLADKITDTLECRRNILITTAAWLSSPQRGHLTSSI